MPWIEDVVFIVSVRQKEQTVAKWQNGRKRTQRTRNLKSGFGGPLYTCTSLGSSSRAKRSSPWHPSSRPVRSGGGEGVGSAAKPAKKKKKKKNPASRSQSPRSGQSPRGSRRRRRRKREGEEEEEEEGLKSCERSPPGSSPLLCTRKKEIIFEFTSSTVELGTSASRSLLRA